MLVLTLPGLVLAGIFLIYPLIDTARLSFERAGPYGAAVSVGWSNFNSLLTDSDFHTAIENNFIFAAVATVGTVVLGTAFALAINRHVRFWRFYRFVFFLPYILPMTIIAIMWSNSLDPNYGWMTAILHAGFPNFEPNGLLDDPHAAIFVVCAVSVWQVTGFPMVIVLGGLQAISPQVVEAAKIDGANAFQVATRIEIPLCKDVIATVTLLQVIFSFKIFDLIQAMTMGGPGVATQVFGTLIYRDAFINGTYGYASSIALVSTIAIVGISLAYLAILKPGHMQRGV
jgi:ABC-type sugar transport system permease subunit